MHDLTSDARIVAKARRGDGQAWATLVERYHPVLLRLAQRCGLSQQDAADVAQTTWLICLEKLGQLHDEAAMLGWLMTIARRESYRLMTQVRRFEPLDGDAEVFHRFVYEQDADDVATQVSHRDELEQLNCAIAELPTHQREVLKVLSSDADLDYASAARRLGMPIGSLGPTRARAVQRLRSNPRLALAG